MIWILKHAFRFVTVKSQKHYVMEFILIRLLSLLFVFWNISLEGIHHMGFLGACYMNAICVGAILWCRITMRLEAMTSWHLSKERCICWLSLILRLTVVKWSWDEFLLRLDFLVITNVAVVLIDLLILLQLCHVGPDQSCASYLPQWFTNWANLRQVRTIKKKFTDYVKPRKPTSQVQDWQTGICLGQKHSSAARLSLRVSWLLLQVDIIQNSPVLLINVSKVPPQQKKNKNIIVDTTL